MYEVKHSISGEVKEAVTQFYKNLFSESVEWRLRVKRLQFLSIDEDTNRWVERTFEKEEVFGAFQDMDGGNSIVHLMDNWASKEW